MHNPSYLNTTFSPSIKLQANVWLCLCSFKDLVMLEGSLIKFPSSIPMQNTALCKRRWGFLWQGSSRSQPQVSSTVPSASRLVTGRSCKVQAMYSFESSHCLCKIGMKPRKLGRINAWGPCPPSWNTLMPVALANSRTSREITSKK